MGKQARQLTWHLTHKGPRAFCTIRQDSNGDDLLQGVTSTSAVTSGAVTTSVQILRVTSLDGGFALL